jgi:Zn-dependent protease with chaperone function
MMHTQMIGLAVAIALFSRWAMGYQFCLAQSKRNWSHRWHWSLIAFLMPSLLLLATAFAIVLMGTSATHPWESQLSYGLSLSFLGLAISRWGYLAWAAVKVQRSLQPYPPQAIAACSTQMTGQVMAVSAVFSAQVGLWKSHLVISQGLIDHLDESHLEAVLTHESGHAHYRDTFWFFWLGGLRQITYWLPYSEALWQELLLLREMRADSWAARTVDPLLLAESLMSVITAPLIETEAICAGFSCAAPRSRLAQRIDALLSQDKLSSGQSASSWLWQWLAIAPALTPLLTIPFHY